MSTGYSQATFDYLRDLDANNDKTWFEANRARYQAEWMAPSVAFVEAVSAALAKLDPPHQAVAKLNKSIRRINRDVRFSKDKTPYDPRVHLIFWTGDHPLKSPAIHLALHKDHAGFGAGTFGLEKDALGRYYDALQSPSRLDELKEAVASAVAVGAVLSPESLKRVPGGITTDPENETFFKRKGLVVRTIDHQEPVESMLGEDGIDRVLKIANALAPINRWLCENI